jgi:hypothetical protein
VASCLGTLRGPWSPRDCSLYISDDCSGQVILLVHSIQCRYHLLNLTNRLTSRRLPLPPTFPLPEKPKCCWACEHMAPAKIDRRTWTSSSRSQSIRRPYYICTTCDNNKHNVFRDSGYPRGFITWDDGIGIRPRNPRCYCGFPSRQDRKGGKANSVGEGFWVCALGACDYFSDRKDGVPYEDAKMLLDFDDFHPHLIERIPK